MAGCHLIIWDVFQKTISSLFFSLLVFQQLRSILLCKDAFQAHLWQKLAFSSPFFYSSDLSSILSSGVFVMLLSSLIFSYWGSCSFRAYPFNRSVVSIIPLLTESHPSAFILPSSCSIPSISNRSVVVIDLYHSLYISCHPRCLHVLLVHCNPYFSNFFNLQGSRDVPCSSFITELMENQQRKAEACCGLMENISKLWGDNRPLTEIIACLRSTKRWKLLSRRG